MGQPQSAPIIEVSYDQLTYEELVKAQNQDPYTINTSRPQTPLQRITKDMVGLMFLYAGTFVICDILRKSATGDWTRLYWMFLGPWNYVTGMPVYNAIKSRLTGKAVAKCNDKYRLAMGKCATTNQFKPWQMQDCLDAAEVDRQACIESTREYSACVDQLDQIRYDWNHPQAPPGDIPTIGPPGIQIPGTHITINPGNWTDDQISASCVDRLEV